MICLTDRDYKRWLDKRIDLMSYIADIQKARREATLFVLLEIFIAVKSFYLIIIDRQITTPFFIAVFVIAFIDILRRFYLIIRSFQPLYVTQKHKIKFPLILIEALLIFTEASTVIMTEQPVVRVLMSILLVAVTIDLVRRVYKFFQKA